MVCADCCRGRSAWSVAGMLEHANRDGNFHAIAGRGLNLDVDAACNALVNGAVVIESIGVATTVGSHEGAASESSAKTGRCSARVRATTRRRWRPWEGVIAARTMCRAGEIAERGLHTGFAGIR